MTTTEEMIVVMQAYLDGKEIEYWDNYPPTWRQATKPTWDWHTTDYRVKPEPERTPFTFEDAEFLIGKVVKHKTTKHLAVITLCFPKSTNIGAYKQLFEEYIFLDGSPCGKLKK